MFYQTEVQSFIRVSPVKFGVPTPQAVLEELREQFENYVSKELGIVIGVSSILTIGDGIIVPGDGAAYYDTHFKLLTYKPEIHEIVLGEVTDITDFGAFLSLGPLDGMIHVSQTMDDFVSFSKANVLTGKETKRTLKIGDKCRARVIAVSYKDVANPRIGLTMRQPLLGNLHWIEEDLKKTTKKEVVVKEGKK